MIYDLDGTLVDTRKDIAQAVNFMLASMNRPELAPEKVIPYVGRGLHHLVQGCLQTQNAAEIERGSQIYKHYYAEHMLDHSRLFPGAREFLTSFKDRKQAVVTNKPNPFSEKLLQALDVADFFFQIVPGNSEYPKKPDPTSLRKMMACQNIQPAEAVFVGDSPIDVEFARNAGIETVCLTHGFSSLDELKCAKPDLIVSTFNELLAEAKRRGW